MLASLAIRDFAIVDELSLEFGPGFTVLTGETGAGKSILVGALGLALGDKAHPDQVRTGAEEARVEAVFAGLPETWGAFLGERGIPAGDGELVVQRRVGRARSQAWLNGAAVPLGLLAEAGTRLVDIHGQHQHQTLLRVTSHVELLDDHGGLAGLRERFGEGYRRLGELDRLIGSATTDRAARNERRDFLRFQVRELESAGLVPGEDVELERIRSLLQNAERVSLILGEALDLLYDGESAAAGQVEAASARLAELGRLIPGGAAGGGEGLTAAAAAIRDVSGELRDLLDKSRYDPEEHARVEERLDLIGRLRRKHGATVDAILARLDELRAEESALGDAESSVETWKSERAGLLSALAAAGGELRAAREKTARRLEKEVAGTLGELGMGKARFSVRLSPRLAAEGPVTLDGKRHEPWEGGLEDVEFLLSANPGEELKPLARVASGGELSRIMLALKGALARVDRVTTLVFDEIDTGIGGKTARAVGLALRRLARERQVLCVTHLPQIAALADEHFTVVKRVERGRTRVLAARLEGPERVAELARMIAGDRVTPAAEEHARELMEV